MQIIYENKRISVIYKKNIIGKLYLFIYSLVYFTQLIYVIIGVNYSKVEKFGVFSIIGIEVIFAIIFTRVIYFYFLEKNVCLEVVGEKFMINGVSHELSDIDSVFICKYQNRIMEPTCHVYLLLKSKRKIPIAIQIRESNALELENTLKKIVNNEKVCIKKFPINI